MPDWHYHANHMNAPARGAEVTAMKDARTLRLHGDPDLWLVDPSIKTADLIREHGAGFPLVVRCHRPDCKIVPREIAAMREP